MPTASIHTLGCRLNQADSALLADRLRQSGYDVVSWGEAADVVIINSCVVTATAERKTGQTVRNARKRWPKAYIVLVGCAVSLEQKASGLPADLFLDNARKHELPHRLPESSTRLSRHPTSPSSATFTEEGIGFYPNHTRANLKVQEGCDFFCSYCIVPYVRGTPRSRDWNDVLREAKELVARGHRELVLTGVNLGTYHDGRRDLAELIRALTELPGDFRIRLGSIEPTPVVRRVIDVMADLAPQRICRFLHLPLQYGEDTILRAMNRRYSTAKFRDHALYALEKINGLCLGTDLIVGFPGENEKRFAECVDFMHSIPWGNLHTFRYSPRSGTAAAKFKTARPDGRLAAERSQIIEKLYQVKLTAYKTSQVGKKLPVLVEGHTESGHAIGWSDTYLEVKIAADIPINTIANPTLTAVEHGRRVLAKLDPEEIGSREETAP